MSFLIKLKLKGSISVDSFIIGIFNANKLLHNFEEN